MKSASAKPILLTLAALVAGIVLGLGASVVVAEGKNDAKREGSSNGTSLAAKRVAKALNEAQRRGKREGLLAARSKYPPVRETVTETVRRQVTVREATAEERVAMFTASDVGQVPSDPKVCTEAVVVNGAAWGRVSVRGCPGFENLVQPQAYAMERIGPNQWRQSWGPEGGTPGCKVPQPYRVMLGFDASPECY